jgi:hypothetical protein
MYDWWLWPSKPNFLGGRSLTQGIIDIHGIYNLLFDNSHFPAKIFTLYDLLGNVCPHLWISRNADLLVGKRQREEHGEVRVYRLYESKRLGEPWSKKLFSSHLP